ncbi:MAG: 7-cyano-7-deazaguanine synthase QueC [Candidatus Koribacter versatilis]|uniref:7-cyano-7-deazaguanine synthase n=1 Tax=Candidatus Korobacter versatilis TaxID=658062 RepID=A0A932EPN2_9BACT|nr:7-cyano-7-deazaguanine synthase QueC [Candidatus Koribacter versatilis]
MAEKAGAVVLVSGGMDSAVCAAIAARDYQPAAMHVSYGQRTEARERRAFTEICDRLGIATRMVIRDESLGKIGGSALTDTSIAVPEVQDVESAIGSKVPVTYVPFRNAHLLAAAVSWAEVLGAKKVLIGAVEQDSSGYPDCRPEFYRAYNEVVRTGTSAADITIETPLIALRKAEIVRRGVELGAPLDLTWSCYSREDVACGVCESCVLRKRAFADAGVRDPVPYAQAVLH